MIVCILIFIRFLKRYTIILILYKSIYLDLFDQLSNNIFSEIVKKSISLYYKSIKSFLKKFKVHVSNLNKRVSNKENKITQETYFGKSLYIDNENMIFVTS